MKALSENDFNYLARANKAREFTAAGNIGDNAIEFFVREGKSSGGERLERPNAINGN